MLREQTAGDADRRARALAGLRAYQDAPRPARRQAAPMRYRRGRARLFDYGDRGSDAPGVVIVPSLINPSSILDLTPDISLMRWLVRQGMRPMLLDWGSPGPRDRDLDITAHIERFLVPLIEKLARPPLLVGYCLGGTMAVAAAAVAPVAGLALIAAPWRFDGYGPAARDDIAALWRAARPAAELLGYVPMEILQAGFWRLDPARTIAKYEAFAQAAPGSDEARQFVAMEDWANAGAPLPFAFASQLFEQFLAKDTPGRGAWRVSGIVVDPRTLVCPTIEFVSRHDRIVPAATAADLPDRHDLDAGHVGMIVGRGARAQLWRPLADWLHATAATRCGAASSSAGPTL